MEKQAGSTRLDKFVWAIRLFKTRAQAAEACKKGRVKVNGAEAKASRILKAGDELEVKWEMIWKKFKVLKLTENRMAAKLVPDFATDLTPPEEYEKVKELKQPAAFYTPQKPGKKQRRAWQKLITHFNDDDRNEP